MNGIQSNNSDRKMIQASADNEGIQVIFEDGISGMVSYSEIPEINEVSMIKSVELPNPFEIKIILKNQKEIELPWDFVRHYCDNQYKARIEEVALQGQKVLGTVIRRIREKQNISQKELAKMADISRATTVRIENGENSPRYRTLQSIASALKTNVSDLLSGNINEKIENNSDYRGISQFAYEKEESYQEGTKDLSERSALAKLEEALTRANKGEWEIALNCIKEAESLLIRVLNK